MEPRMPWAVDGFTSACERCGDCIEACDESVIRAGDGGYPTIDFERGGCTFCGDCVQACKHDALDATIQPAWRLVASIAAGCLSAQGITCRACGDVCETRAIRFRLETGGRAIPELEPSSCNGCGSCIATCPTHVIQIQEAA